MDNVYVLIKAFDEEPQIAIGVYEGVEEAKNDMDILLNDLVSYYAKPSHEKEILDQLKTKEVTHAGQVTQLEYTLFKDVITVLQMEVKKNKK